MQRISAVWSQSSADGLAEFSPLPRSSWRPGRGSHLGIFRPGFLDSDGVAQLRMAVDNHYHDWFSPLLPLALHWAMKAGSKLSAVTLIQAVFGSLGVYSMAAEVLRFLTRYRRPEWQMRWGGVTVLPSC